MEAKVVELKPMRVLCMRHSGPYPEIGEAFERLMAYVKREKISISDSQVLAVYWDDPETTPVEKLRSAACATVGEGFEIRPDRDVFVGTVPGGLYATTRHIGHYSGLPDAWGCFFREWLPTSGYKVRRAPCLEIYINSCEDTPADQLITDLYEPVEPL